MVDTFTKLKVSRVHTTMLWMRMALTIPWTPTESNLSARENCTFWGHPSSELTRVSTSSCLVLLEYLSGWWGGIPEFLGQTCWFVASSNGWLRVCRWKPRGKKGITGRASSWNAVRQAMANGCKRLACWQVQPQAPYKWSWTSQGVPSPNISVRRRSNNTKHNWYQLLMMPSVILALVCSMFHILFFCFLEPHHGLLLVRQWKIYS